MEQARRKGARARDNESQVQVGIRGKVGIGLGLPHPLLTVIMVMGDHEGMTRGDMVVGGFSHLIRLGIKGNGNWKRKKKEEDETESGGSAKRTIEGGWSLPEDNERKRKDFAGREKS